MKKLFTTLALCASITMGAFAQHCPADSSAATPPPPTGTPGLTPASDSLAPAKVGTYISDTIYFNNYTQFSTYTIGYLQIDSINNLPDGLCWVTNTGSNRFAGGASGLIIVSGTPQGTPGQYKLVIWITVNVGAVTLPEANAEQLTGTAGTPLRYYVRLNCHGDTVEHPIDTVNETNLNSIFERYDTLIPNYYNTYCLDSTAGVREIANNISNVSVEPNPFASSAKVTFTSNVEGSFTMKMMNLLGEVVSSKEISIVRGDNTFEQDRNGLSPGIYLMSISNGQSAITRKVIIE